VSLGDPAAGDGPAASSTCRSQACISHHWTVTSTSQPRIFADFNKSGDREDSVRLTTLGTRADLERLGLTLSQGMKVTISDGEIEADAVIERAADDQAWIAVYGPVREVADSPG
jgi:hypothetical protein